MPEDLRRAAVLLSSRGSHLSEIGGGLLRTANSSQWAAPSADRFRHALTGRRNAMIEERDRLEQLAGRLRRLADHYEAQLRECRTIEANVRRWFAANRFVTPPDTPRWQGWQWTPYSRLPATNSAEWLNIRDYFRARGVSV